jgi:acetyl esterase
MIEVEQMAIEVKQMAIEVKQMARVKYAIHRDFQRVRISSVSFHPLMLGLINGALKVHRIFAKRKFNGSITTARIAGVDGNGITVKVMAPDNIETVSPALVYYHGGAFALTYVPAHMENAKRYAQEARCRVVFVSYRLAPRFPFPCGFNDAYSALIWTVTHAGALGIDKGRIAVGGDSAGGAIAASVAQKCIQVDGIRLCGQLLIYPVTDCDCKTPSAVSFTDTPPFNAISNRKMWDAYLLQDVGGTRPPPYASPAHGTLDHLAPAYVEVAEFDPLHDEGREYADALTSNRVDVVLNETRGTIHGYDLLVASSEISKASLTQRIDFLKRVFNRGAP